MTHSSPPTPLADAPHITPMQGNAAAFTLLLLQIGLSGLLMHFTDLGIGVVMFITFSLTIATIFAVFRQPLSVLRQDARWRSPLTLRLWGLTLGVFVLGFLVSRLWSVAATLLLPNQKVTTPNLISSDLDQVLLLLTGALLIPFAEELVFRGLMLRSHERAAGFGLAALSSSVAFAFAHQVPVQVLGILPLAYALARVVQYTGSFWTAVIIHVLNNGFSLGMLWLLKANNLLPKGDLSAMTQVNPSVKLPMGLALLLLGVGGLAILHFWLKPKPDGVALGAAEARHPWFDVFYLLILAWGLLTFGLLLLNIPIRL